MLLTHYRLSTTSEGVRFMIAWFYFPLLAVEEEYHRLMMDGRTQNNFELSKHQNRKLTWAFSPF